MKQSPQPLDPVPIRVDLERLANWMDSAFRVPGTNIRFGLDPLIGLVPGLGDMLTTLVSLYILRVAHSYGVSRLTLARMALNIAIDSLAGSLPVVGDAFDLYWKANQRNVALLRSRLVATPQEARRGKLGDGLFLAGLMLGLLALVAGSVAIVYVVVTALGRLLFPTG